MRLPLAAFVAMLALLALAPPAVAQGNAEARIHFEDGNRHFARAGRLRGPRRTEALEAALSSYMRTLSVVRSRNALFNTVIVLEQLGRPAEAYGFLYEYLAIRGLSEAERREGEAKGAALAERVAIVSAVSEPVGAEVFVDRLDLAPRGTAPMELAVEPGTHRIYFRLPYHATAEVSVDAVVGERREARATLDAEPVRVTLEVMAPPGTPLLLDGERAEAGSVELSPGLHVARLEPAGATPVERRFEVRPGEPMRVRLEASGGGGRSSGTSSTLVVQSDTAVSVSVDGAPMGQGERVEAALTAGSHAVEVRVPGREPVRRIVQLREGRTTTLRASAEPETRPLGVLPHVALGLTAAGVGATLGLGIRTRNMNEKNEERCNDQPSMCEQLGSEVDSAAVVTDLVLGVTGALAVTTLILYLLNRPRGNTTLEVDASASARGASLRIGGRF